MYVITGASGNTGKAIAEKLLANGQKVRVIARNADKLQDLVKKGAEASIGDLSDPQFLSKAFSGATAVYAMIPPNIQAPDIRASQQKVGKAIVEGIKNGGVKNVVALSSVGAHMESGAGVVQGLYDFEQYLYALPNLNVLALRPGYFMENLWFQKDLIKNMGITGSPLKGDVPFAIVATKDIAEVAAKHLLKLDFTGQSHEYILGAKHYSYNEIAKIIGNEIGKPELPYVQFPYEDAQKSMVQMGMSESMANGMIELNKAMNSGEATSDLKRTAENTTPTTIEDFAKIFAGVYKSELQTA